MTKSLELRKNDHLKYHVSHSLGNIIKEMHCIFLSDRLEFHHGHFLGRPPSRLYFTLHHPTNNTGIKDESL